MAGWNHSIPAPGFSPVGQELVVKLLSDMHNKNYEGKRRRSKEIKEFIAWDGEGVKTDDGLTHFMGLTFGPDGITEAKGIAQPYVLLAHSKGEHIRSEFPYSLSTRDCFEFILDTKVKYPNSIFVGFGFNYDINQLLADVPDEVLERMIENDKGSYSCGGYWVEWRPGKHLIIKHRKTRRSAIIYDVFGFFQMSFLKACKEYLGEDDPDLAFIEQGKEKRSEFSWDEIDEFIIPYNKLELTMLVRVMNQLRQNLWDVGIHPSQWHGPGAIADAVFRKYHVPIDRTAPKEILDASQYAYAGGRFEQFRLGRYAGRVYEYDIHSAYPAAALKLPDLTDGSWEYVESYERGAFGVYYIEYCDGAEKADRYVRPQPLFHRSEDGSISYPPEVQGWYWAPEAGLVVDSIKYGFIFRPASQACPFTFVEDLYDERRALKAAGNPTQRAIKLILNSLYGKLAQTIGGRNGPPSWHQLEYAGYITSYTRAMIYEAITLNPGAIIAAETDAVFSIEPLDLPCTDELGDWERKEHEGIVYLQSGFYYAGPEGIVCKYRGMDRDRATQQPDGLPYRKVLDHLARRSGQKNGKTKALRAHTTRFIGLGMAIKTKYTWRSWRKEDKRISLDQDPGGHKRYHMTSSCPECAAGFTLDDCLHTMFIGGSIGESTPRILPWRKVVKDDGITEVGAPINWEEYQEQYQEYLRMEEADRWS